MFSLRTSLPLIGLLSVSYLGSCSDDSDTQWAFYFNSNTGTSETHVLVTDSPADELESFHLGIDSLQVHREDGEKVAVLRPESAFRTDLLALRRHAGQRFFEVLTAGADLESGRYNRVSIALSDPQGRLRDGETLRFESLPGATEIEIDLEEPIELRPGHTHYIIVDIDVDRSLVYGGDGEGGVVFRPLVLIEDHLDRLPEDARTVRNVDGAVIEAAGVGESVRVALDGDRGELTIDLRRATAVLDQQDRRSFADSFSPGDHLSLSGTWTDTGKLTASHVIVSPDGG